MLCVCMSICIMCYCMIPISIVLKRKKSKALKQIKFLFSYLYLLIGLCSSVTCSCFPKARWISNKGIVFCAFTCEYSITVIYCDRTCLVDSACEQSPILSGSLICQLKMAFGSQMLHLRCQWLPSHCFSLEPCISLTTLHKYTHPRRCARVNVHVFLRGESGSLPAFLSWLIKKKLLCLRYTSSRVREHTVPGCPFQLAVSVLFCDW